MVTLMLCEKYKLNELNLKIDGLSQNILNTLQIKKSEIFFLFFVFRIFLWKEQGNKSRR